MKIVSFDDVNSLNISPMKCYEWVDEMIKNKSECLLPSKTHMNMPGNVFCNVMPSLLDEPLPSESKFFSIYNYLVNHLMEKYLLIG